VAFRDSLPDDPADQLTLATHGQVGSVYGLAYDPALNVLYAAAYHKRGVPFGPAGPGGIYRIEVAGGAVTVLARLPAGADLHNFARNDDESAAAGVGQASLGGIALNADGSELTVANLADQKLYRVATADGSVLGSFDRGAPEDRKQRLFAVAWRNGALLHGVVKADDDGLQGFVYQSEADGTGLREVAAFDLAYGRRPPWYSWATFGGQGGNAQPMLTDIVGRTNGDLVLGLRDRRIDMSLVGTGPSVVPGGDILPAYRSGGRWVVTLQPEAYADDGPADEVVWGGLALMPGLDMVVAAAADAVTVAGGRALVGGQAWWFDNRGGARMASESLYRVAGGRTDSFVHGLGDVAALCDPYGDYPDLRGTATAGAATAAATATLIAAQTVSPTLTAEATVRWATQTAAAATGTAGAPATATRRADDLARLAASCGTDNPMFFVTCFVRDLDRNAVLAEPAIVAFNDTPNDDMDAHVVLASQEQVGATYGLAWDQARGQLYAGAFHKRGTFFGPGGPGAVYRIDVATGEVIEFARMAAGPDFHVPGGNFDEPAAPWVGKLSLGDVELDAAGGTLFVMNLWDRRVHRFSVPDGAELGSFPAGDEEASWIEDARPFGLGFRDGWLFQGVVDAAERAGAGGVPVGYVYRSRPDGAELAEVARFDLDYARPAGTLWNAWSDATGTDQPILSDIEFRPDGDLLLGLRDRRGDSQILTIGMGDLLPTVKNGDRWDVVTDPERYQDDVAPHQENTWGGLAAFPERDWVVTSALAPVTINSGGALWLDNETGANLRPESIYITFRGAQMLPTFAKSEGLGDVEGYCPPFQVPTVTPTDTEEPTATPTPSATPTASATPVPEPIYLPVILNEACEDRVQHADVVMVIDVSTSMSRPTSLGRAKLDAARDAVREFLGRMQLQGGPGGQDQVALVGFNDMWWLEQALTADRGALERAVDRLPGKLGQGTRLDLAVEGGLAALSGAGRNPANTPVMILLTDGLPNRVPTPVPSGSQEDTVLAVAARAKAAGVRLFTVGIGQPTDIDGRLLSAMANSPDMYFFTPDAEELRQIYAQIAVTIACPGGRHDWGKPWP
jgi:Mg-chelatase subunit ChlD